MLTKSLVRYRTYRGAIKPQFADPEDRETRALAECLAAVFADGVGQSRDALLERTTELIEASRCDNILARGLEKLLLDRARFESPDDEERPRLRQRVFSRVSRMMTEEAIEDFAEFERRTAELFGEPHGSLAARLYSDLPGQQPLAAFEPITAERLVHRYNLSLVQWLVSQSHGLELTIWDAAPGAMRQLFKYMRFHQLLARVVRTEKGVWRLLVDGPLSLFQQTKKYGLNLANFVPAVLLQDKWALRAEVTVKNRRKGELRLDNQSGLRAEPERFLAYVPEEIAGFRESLRQKLTDWQVEDGGYLALPGDHYCFPDFTLAWTGGGPRAAVELFHAWHAAHLAERLRQLTEIEGAPLIVGVDTRLAKKPETAALLADSAYFAEYGFVFRDLPTPGKLAPVLKGIARRHGVKKRRGSGRR